ncbi:MAG: ABC-F family ATP-binding cassette domain-containing protein, partial [Blautia hansenii]
MILACQNIEKSFDGVTLLADASFHIEEREKAALVGINGAGKSTLFKIIVGELPPDSGQVILAKGKTMGYLAQHQELTSDLSIYDALLQVKQHILDMEVRMRQLEKEMKYTQGEELNKIMEAYSRLTHEFELENGYAYKSELTGVLKGLGFAEEDFGKMISTLSGGQKTRVALGRLLLSKPDIILLDEPTNHLDMDSIAWLETYLLNYPGAVFIVSHDRYFLDKVATKIVEIDNTKVTSFTGNYSAYSEKKAMLRRAAYQAYLNQQQEIKHQEAVIAKLKSFNREKSIRRAESREKMLDKIEVLEKPVEVDDSMRITLKPRVISGNDVLTVEHLTKSFPSLPLFEDLNFQIKRGERVAIIGSNGTGKTTILKILNQVIPADNGSFRLGSKVHIGYYDQEHHVLHMEKTIFEEISDDYPKLTNTEIRNLLAAFLFTGDDVFKPISALSGGERGRVSLAKLMLSQANFLILDEPTNHLDITSKEIMVEALNYYEWT